MSVRISVDAASLKAIERELDGNTKEARNILKKAVNKTAREAKKKLAARAKSEYAVKGGAAEITKEMELKSAITSNPVAVITAKGKSKGLIDFKVTPTKVARTGNRPKLYRGKVLRGGSLKSLIKDGRKAFIAALNRKNGKEHLAVMYRVNGVYMKKKEKREQIKEAMSPSVPQMVGSEKRVFGQLEPEIGQDLQNNLKLFMDKHKGG